jgi:hypothetical protein
VTHALHQLTHYLWLVSCRVRAARGMSLSGAERSAETLTLSLGHSDTHIEVVRMSVCSVKVRAHCSISRRCSFSRHSHIQDAIDTPLLLPSGTPSLALCSSTRICLCNPGPTLQPRLAAYHTMSDRTAQSDRLAGAAPGATTTAADVPVATSGGGAAHGAPQVAPSSERTTQHEPSSLSGQLPPVPERPPTRAAAQNSGPHLLHTPRNSNKLPSRHGGSLWAWQHRWATCWNKQAVGTGTARLPIGLVLFTG